MVDKLRSAIERAQQVTDSAQRALAAQIEAWLDEQEWNEIINNPEGQKSLARRISEAVAGISRGEVEEGDSE